MAVQHESGAEQYEGYSCPAPERIPLRGKSLTVGVIRRVVIALPGVGRFISEE
jgi:hypothetical protein